MWRETRRSPYFVRIVQFQSTPSVWRETLYFYNYSVENGISIHSLRVEGDPVNAPFGSALKIFQSTPSVWRETVKFAETHFLTRISIHSLRVEGDLIAVQRWRETANGTKPIDTRCDFNPLPPCGGRLYGLQHSLTPLHFNPLPPCGGRLAGRSGGGLVCNFNPLPPCGGRRHCVSLLSR